MSKIYDLIIVGAGPIGLACGIEARKNQLNYLIIDKGALANSLYNYPLNMTFFSTSEKLEIGNVPFISHNYKPNRNEALEYYRRVTDSWDLNIKLYTRVENISHKSGIFLMECSNGFSIRAKKIIIATGFYDIPHMMNVEGEALPRVYHYYKEAHPYAKQKVVVIGCANSAVDAALECYRKGSSVTMVVRSDAISPRVKYWVKPDIENRIREGSIRCYFNSSVKTIKPDTLLISTPEGELTLEYDHLLALTGYKPDFNFLLNCGIQLERNTFKPIYNPATMETNVPGIYLAGVICGGLETHKWFIENSRVHAEIILNHIISNRS